MPLYISSHLFSIHYLENNVFDVKHFPFKIEILKEKVFSIKAEGGNSLPPDSQIKLFQKNPHKE